MHRNTSRPSPFIRSTYKLLSKSSTSSLISWSLDGRSFIIKDQHQFTTLILPQYFKHQNFASFNRQLNNYGFRKTREDALEFSHPLFQRNNKILLTQICRKTSEPSISKENTDLLSKRLKKFQTQQSGLEDMFERLEKQYELIVEQNQTLVSELIESKQREKRIEVFIKSIGKRKCEKNDLVSETEEFLCLSPLGQSE